MSLAVVVIASEKRMNSTFPLVMQSVVDERPDEIVCVADFHCAGPWRHIMIPAFTKTTIDALIKRDVGFVATQSDTVMFLSDDHILWDGFVEDFRNHDQEWDVLVPRRVVKHPTEKNAYTPLNMGQATNYCAGHAGLYKRRCGHILPWTATIPHPNWDVIYHHHLIAQGLTMKYAGRHGDELTGLIIEDIEGGTPWL
jgi:hypothetical protein